MTKGDEITWYVVADGGKARVLVREADGMREISAFDAEGHGDATENDAAEIAQIKAPHADPHGQVKQLFARQVAAHLDRAANDHTVDRIVLAAPGTILHEIREALGKPATHMLGTCLSKDLTNIPTRELASHFA